MPTDIERTNHTKTITVSTTAGGSTAVDYSAISVAALCFPAARAGEVVTIHVYDYEQSAYFSTGVTLTAAAWVKVPDDVFAADNIKFVTAGTAATVTMHAKG